MAWLGHATVLINFYGLRILTDPTFFPRIGVDAWVGTIGPLRLTQCALAPEAVRGIKVVRQGFHDYSRGSLVEGVDPRGYPYFWFGLHAIEQTPGHQTDLEAIADGYISVTPLQLDLTHEPAMLGLAERYAREGTP